VVGGAKPTPWGKEKAVEAIFHAAIDFGGAISEGAGVGLAGCLIWRRVSVPIKGIAAPCRALSTRRILNPGKLGS
jgi:hypothetical protein